MTVRRWGRVSKWHQEIQSHSEGFVIHRNNLSGTFTQGQGISDLVRPNKIPTALIQSFSAGFFPLGDIDVISNKPLKTTAAI